MHLDQQVKCHAMLCHGMPPSAGDSSKSLEAANGALHTSPNSIEWKSERGWNIVRSHHRPAKDFVSHKSKSWPLSGRISNESTAAQNSHIMIFASMRSRHVDNVLAVGGNAQQILQRALPLVARVHGAFDIPPSWVFYETLCCVNNKMHSISATSHCVQVCRCRAVHNAVQMGNYFPYSIVVGVIRYTPDGVQRVDCVIHFEE